MEDERYRVNPSLVCEFDADLFEAEARSAMRELRAGADTTPALAAALARYRGDFLANEAIGEWAAERRDRLRHLYLDALAALGRAHMDRERYSEAADVFSTLLTADPVNEDACQRQMMCLAQLGDRASVLRVYDALVRALRTDLGVRPSRETVAVRDRIFSNSGV
jgi:DNA-binding SARP family transcriptional activator